ncbi:tryptophan-rich sensory protein [soil metagenome]
MDRIIIRKAAVIAATVFAIAAPAVQSLAHFGLSAQQFSETGDTTLRAAGYAFAIWGPIYLGMILYAGRQAFAGRADQRLLGEVGWPSVIAIAGCGAWILASASNARWPSVAIIVGSAAVLTGALLSLTAPRQVRGWDVALVLTPLDALAGWLTVASALNVLTVLTALGFVTGSIRVGVGAAGVLATAAVAVAVAVRLRRLAYPAAVTWGLVGVWVAMREGTPLTAWVAAGCAAAVAIAGLTATFAGARQTGGR